MTANRLITLVENRPGIEHRLDVPEHLFDLPELFVLDGNPGGGQLVHIGAQNPFAVEPGFGVNLLTIDDHAVTGNLQEPGIAAIADQSLRIASEPFLQSGNHGFPGSGVLARLFLVAADNIASAVDEHLFDRQRRRALDLGGCREDVMITAGSGEHRLAYFLDPPHPGSENIGNAIVLTFKYGDGVGADHAAIGNDAEALDAEPPAQPIDHRHQALHIGSVAGPQFAADRPATVIENGADHHLLSIRPVIFTVPELSQGLAAFALEIDRGGVEEDQIEPGEERPVLVKQAFFDQILGAAGSECGCVALISKLFTEKGHGPVDVVQGDIFHSVDGIVSSPPIGVAIGSGTAQPMQDGKKDCPLHIELELAPGQQLFDDLRNPEFLPDSLKDQGRANAYGGDIGVDRTGQHQQGLLGKSCQRANQGFDPAFGMQFVEPPQGGDDPLLDLSLLFAILDELHVLIATGFLDSGEHRGSSLVETPQW
jgi:hypothetical protein